MGAALEAHARARGTGDVSVDSVNPAAGFVWPSHKLRRGVANVKTGAHERPIPADRLKPVACLHLVHSPRDCGRPPRPAARARLPRAPLRRARVVRAHLAAAARGRRRRPPGLPRLRRARAPAGRHATRGARPGDLPPAGRAREPRPPAAGSVRRRPRRRRTGRADRADAVARGGGAVRLRALARRDVLGARHEDGGADAGIAATRSPTEPSRTAASRASAVRSSTSSSGSG